ncbi:MAG TPA: glucoamylase family protein [Aggregatilineaceae bacterium]|nr:glucoamylase family protein [Aggregatilineaceae bacterium]
MVSYAGEWFLDNFYLIQQNLQQILEDMPSSFYKKLPTLITTEYPRVYILAHAILDTTDASFNLQQIKNFVESYQRVTALTMGELWALPAMLRIRVLEVLATTVIQLAGLPAEPQQITAYSPHLTSDIPAETIVANCVTSLRMLNTQDWKTFFENLSLIEQILRQDPAEIYADMDFETRNTYRKVIEKIALASKHDEGTVAQTAIDLAKQAVLSFSENGLTTNRLVHVGYYLIDQGHRQLEHVLGYRRAKQWDPTFVYLGGIFALTLLILVGIGTYLFWVGAPITQILGAILLVLIPGISLAVNGLNWILTHTLKPRILPKMDFEQKVPAPYQTMIVMPVLLTSTEEVELLVQQLELHFLRNPEEGLYFAVLADFADAPMQHMANDEALLDEITHRINALNARYQRMAGERFYCFVRERRWNPAENVWMGWERKRGKLNEFNQLLLTGSSGSYTTQIGDLSILNTIHFVFTLDADTVLPKGSALRLIGTLAHPLNHAEFSPNGTQVVSGYTILQPRVEILPTAANRSRFAQLFAGNTGIDLYTLAVSDTYQDLFGEGIYVGKGIYDVAAFERSLAGRVPENTLLSHDLFEGLNGRAALVTDIILLEDYPMHYLAHIRRLHRWIRGDWQLLPWILPGTKGAIFSTIDRWKIIDNLRRSLYQPALFLLFAAGWLWLPGSMLIWTGVALLFATLPFIPNRSNTRHDLQRWLLSIVFLPFEALTDLSAIIVTIPRLIRHKHLLQWTTAAHTAQYLKNRSMDSNMLLAEGSVLGLALLIGFIRPESLLVSAPFFLLWLLTPWFVRAISQPTAQNDVPLSPQEHQQLRTLARRTWLYFEQFIGPADHWLPPDHFQKSPRGIVAHQTSPTNIGLLLLSTLTAHDFGYIGKMELAVRLRSTFENLDKLERYRGHFLNWYNTQTLEPLPPSYVSTVDSGNLAGCLLALRQGLASLDNLPILRTQRWEGMLDTLAVLHEILDSLNSPNVRQLKDQLEAIRGEIERLRDQPTTWAMLITRLLDERWPAFGQQLIEFIDAEGEKLDETMRADLRIYLERSRAQLFSMRRDMEVLLPWLPLLHQAPAIFTLPTTPATIRDLWTTLVEALPVLPPFTQISDVSRKGGQQTLRLQELLLAQPTPDQEALTWCSRLIEELDSARSSATALMIGFSELRQATENYFQAMDFGFLFDSYRCLFHIGYNVATETLDNSYYDLLASEARLASYIAIAKGDVPHQHWLHMARPLSALDGMQALLSWSGTMFEYMMPWLLMRHYENTLLYQSCQVAVEHQIAYGWQKDVPWGISESGYYAFDGNLNYQYRAFGVPRLAFKRGQAVDLVIAPYASLIALPIAPQAVMQNIIRLNAASALSTYGFYEAIDYTARRLPLGETKVVVQEYMAHHQGMIFVTLANYLYDNIMVQRFHADPRMQSIELLLQERIPQQIFTQPAKPDELPNIGADQTRIALAPWSAPVDAYEPSVHYLSNGRYGVLITGAGGGYSQWNETALTRWHADTTLENWGTWIYILDQDSGELWSASYQPTGTTAASQDVLFYAHKAEFRRSHQEISAHMEITVAPDDDLEIRRITVTNHSARPRRLRLASYGEVTLVPQQADQRHPAFNKLFIESESLPDLNALIFRRRPRSEQEEPCYLMHVLITEASESSPVFYETDRGTFIGRGRTTRTPAVLHNDQADFSGTVGATLDPILSLGQDVELQPHTSMQLAFLTLASSSRQKLIILARTYQDWLHIERAFEQSRYRSERELRQMALSTTQVETFQKLLGALLYPHSRLRATPAILGANTQNQSGLWAFGISGDYPILLVRIGDESELELVHSLLQAHTYWRNRGLKITLVILNQRDTEYTQELYHLVHRLIVRMGSEIWINRHDGVFILNADQMSETSRILLETSARVLLDGKKGLLLNQLEVLEEQPIYLPPFTPLPGSQIPELMPALERPADLLFDNGWGGFSPDGREYIIYLQAGQQTPAPWINVIANPQFGFTVSEAGSGFSWNANSSENRLTVWRNDPVSDMPSEALYLRDEETSAIWSPTPLPAGTQQPYLVRHGAGYTMFEHHSHGLKQQLRLFATVDDSVKIIHLRLENLRQAPRRITATYYAEWVLGTLKDITQPYIVPDFDVDNQTLLARNPYSMEFGGHVTFAAASKNLHGLTTDRNEFLGRLQSYHEPSALKRVGLAGTIRPGIDPCAVLQLHIDLPPGGSEEVFFLLGQGENREAALQLVRRYREPEQIEHAWNKVTAFWEDMLTTVTINTPESSMNVILPWLLYQTLSCRIWGRSALYQSGGAFGFRDQLQDVIALLHVRPDLTRDHILTAARSQFEAGDVLHWWHPPSGRGIRTRFSDDLLWLPYVVTQYIAVTRDYAILRERLPFLKGEPLKPEEEERYGFYDSTLESFTLYEHCRRALDKGYTSGPHGLPLMGTGDWNDGMNRVGVEGRGESIWVGWFLCATMSQFTPLCEEMDDHGFATLLESRTNDLRRALEQHGWDGEWYLRAFYDDGSPLGSSQNDECQIDTIAQSWGVLSGAANPQRANQAMLAVDQQLIKDDDSLILLFAPPFDQTVHDPGYIKGYPPGIRENGGQYTHAAIWTIWAFAQLGQGDRAMELFTMLNPITHGDAPEKVQCYRVEPYVAAADVYSIPPHTGRGGWTWYTGSSGWMYRLGLEAILGFRREGQMIHINPSIPAHWPGFELTYHYLTAVYYFRIENIVNGRSQGNQTILDGKLLLENSIPLVDDGKEHHVTIMIDKHGI